MFENLEKELDNIGMVKIKERRNVIEKAVKFTNEIRKQFGDIIKSVLIFGSSVRGDMKKSSDIDIWVIIDDTTKSSEDYEKIVSHLYLIASELKDLHVQVNRLTEFWEWIKKGSPELINFLRYGLAIYDTGFIKPVQRMLNLGLIPPSEETIVLKARASEVRLKRIKEDLKILIFDLRYSALDIIQAVIMYYFKVQTDYKDSIIYLEKLVKEGKIEAEYLEKFKKLNSIWKDIDHKVIEEVKVSHLEEALSLAKDIVERFKKLLPSNLFEEVELR